MTTVTHRKADAEKLMKSDFDLLSGYDIDHIRRFSEKAAELRSFTTQVARGEEPGLYTFGPSGTWARWIVLDQLAQVPARSIVKAGREILRSPPDEAMTHVGYVYVVQNADPLLIDHRGWNLMSRRFRDLPPQDCCKPAVGKMRYPGGAILVGHFDTEDEEWVNELQENIPVIPLSFSHAEQRAMLRHLAVAGYGWDERLGLGDGSEPSVRLEVCEAVIEVCEDIDRPLDPAILTAAHLHCDQWFERLGQSMTMWAELFAGELSVGKFTFPPNVGGMLSRYEE